MSRVRFGRQFMLLSLSLILGAFSTGSMQSFAAQPPAAELSDKDLSLLENRYFAHPYGHDPVEKRLERLECLVFGATKGGSNPDRLARLNKAVAQRSAMPVPVEKSITGGSSASANVAPGNAGGKGAAASYPVLNTIEWRALKKTYSAESLDQRLDRLESKMFGQPAQTMAYIDRVERLKKTLGITGNDGIKQQEGLTARGPMPKARPRGEGEMPDYGIGGGAPLEGMMPPMFNPFGTGGQLDTIFGATFDKMFQDMQRMGDGRGMIMENQRSFTLDPRTGAMVETTPGAKNKLAPGQGPRGTITPIPNGFRFNFGVDSGMGAPNMMPVPPQRQGGSNNGNNIQELPPYADPNSI